MGKTKALPLCSSNEVINVLRRAEFEPKSVSKSGSHQTWVRKHADGRKDITYVVLGKKQIPRGTLRDIVDRANITEAEFLGLLKRKG